MFNIKCQCKKSLWITFGNRDPYLINKDENVHRYAEIGGGREKERARKKYCKIMVIC